MDSALLTRRAMLKFAGVLTFVAKGGNATHAFAANPRARGYGRDPDLASRNVTWPRTLKSSQLTVLSILSDIVLPAEPPYPSASATGVHLFIDEWLSAPYDQMQEDRVQILAGLAALDEVTGRKHGQPFINLQPHQQVAAFDDLCGTERTFHFCRRLIALVCDGYYTTREGHAAIGYVGNVGLAAFPGPPPEVVEHLDRALIELAGATRSTSTGEPPA